ncbi:MAG: ATP-binding protein [Myxococcaceae bacterium]
MRLRLLVSAAMISVLAVGLSVAWVVPVLRRSAPGEGAVGWVLALDALTTCFWAYLLLHFTIGRPAERVAARVRELRASDDESGALLERLDRALRKLALDLEAERLLNRQQLTELTASRDSLFRLQAELVGADRLATVGKLAAGVAHEVGNPLAGILGYLSVMRMKLKGNPDLELVDRIEAEVHRIDSIVRSLLELGRPSRGAATPTDVRAVIDGSVRLLGASREFENVKIEIDAPASLYLRAEPGPLSQVLINLMINSAQAMGGKGRLWVRATDAGVLIEDEGPGIPDAIKARLFEPFFTTKEPGKGTGLGLAVSRHLLRQFGADLTAGDRPGGGARFTVSLPRA